MRIIGTGVDIVSIKRIAKIHTRYPETFNRRILSEPEHREFISKRDQAAFLAKHFAAKEAVAKALGTGMGRGLCFTDIVIDHDPLGRPLVRFASDQVMDYDAKDLEVHISISDEQEYAVASVIVVDGAL
ncbi:MAG: holo-ACP synthase [Gammaproteobacteria bacterium]|nr:holo-ACP synthase [Gammaproteobacteria bacterium]